MAIKYVYLGASFILFVLVQSLTPESKTRNIWAPVWLPVPLNIIFQLLLGLLIYANGIAIISAIAVAVIHTIWILTGQCSLSKSVRKTWVELRRDKFFEEDQPSWLNTRAERVEQLTTNSTGELEDVGVRIRPSSGKLYQALNLENGEIRLLKVVSDKSSNDPPNGILRFEMIHQALTDDTNSYTALSYCVGGGEPDKTIKITSPEGNDVEVTIRTNLYNALCRVIDHKCELLWASTLHQQGCNCPWS
jgi:hypothetical protein